MSKDSKSGRQLPLDLDCSSLQPTGPSFTPAPGDEGGGLLSCSIGPLAEETIAALDQAAHEHTRVRLLFGATSVLLEAVTLERKDAQRVRIVGHVVSTPRPQSKA